VRPGRQRLKLANVAPRFIKAYRAGDMQLEQLEALAITDDHQAQEQAWEPARHDWERSAHNYSSFYGKNGYWKTNSFVMEVERSF
jgi:hypothetical protein